MASAASWMFPMPRARLKNPLTEQEIVAKARLLLEPVLGVSRADAFIDAALALEIAADFAAMARLLEPRGEPA